MNIFKTGVVKKRLSLILIALALLACTTEIFAADPGHAAPAIGSGMSESGNCTFLEKKRDGMLK